MRVRSGFVFIIATTVIALPGPQVVQAQIHNCPFGTVPIVTSEDRAKATVAGIPTSSGCWNPKDAFVGDEVAVATKFLIEHMGNGTRGTQCYQSQTDRITKLNPAFKVGLYKALTEIERLYGGKNIIQSGYRCDGSNGNHPRGCAVDIIWASCKAKGGDGWRCSSDRFDAPEQKWIDANGKNPPYNIHIRLRFAPEGHHVEPVNTQGCRTGAVVGSDNSTASPSSNFTNAIRQALGMQQQPPAQPQPILPPQPLPMMQQVTSAFNEPVQEIKPSVSDSLVTGGETTASTTADKLEDLAFGKKPSSPAMTTTATSVPVYLDGSDVGGVASKGKQEPVTATAGIGGSVTQTTFTDTGLGWQTGAQSTSGFRQILANISAALQRILQMIQPFGGVHLHEEEYDY